MSFKLQLQQHLNNNRQPRCYSSVETRLDFINTHAIHLTNNARFQQGIPVRIYRSLSFTILILCCVQQDTDCDIQDYYLSVEMMGRNSQNITKENEIISNWVEELDLKIERVPDSCDCIAYMNNCIIHCN